MITSYKDLLVWQKGIELTVKVYKLTEAFPREESYGLISQMRRCAVSVPSNIAEGRNRGTRKDFRQFLRVALGSLAELETQIEIAKLIEPTNGLDYSDIDILIVEVTKMTKALIKSLSTLPSKTQNL